MSQSVDDEGRGVTKAGLEAGVTKVVGTKVVAVYVLFRHYLSHIIN